MQRSSLTSSLLCLMSGGRTDISDTRLRIAGGSLSNGGASFLDSSVGGISPSGSAESLEAGGTIAVATEGAAACSDSIIREFTAPLVFVLRLHFSRRQFHEAGRFLSRCPGLRAGAMRF